MRSIILIVLLTLELFSNSIRFTESELKWMEKKPSISYVGDPEWLPFEGFNERGEYIGIVSELLKYIQSITPLKFKIIKTASWDKSLQIINSNKAMMISQSQDSNNKTALLFSKIYYKNPIIIVMDTTEYVPSLKDIDTKKISIIKNEPFFEKIYAKYPTIDFIDVNSVEDGLQSVVSGETDAFVNTLARTSYTIANLQLNNLKIVGRTEFYTKLGFGISPKYPQLKTILDKVIKNIPPNIKNKILSKWIHQKYVEKTDYTLTFIIISIFSIFFGMWIYFYMKLKKESNARIEAQNKMLEQQSKMASMGEMLDAVAHQWKQPLNVITMYLDMLQSDFEDGIVDKKYIDEMQEGTHSQIEHMTTTLREFRNFFRPNRDIEDFNLLELTNSVLLLTKDEFLKNQITIDVEIDKEITLKGNKNEFKHLIINIINNAKDAFNDNEIKNRKIIIKATKENNHIILEIEDNAGGIPQDVISHIFEANFTTKEVGKGTGIGLYMSKQILEKMGGMIKVKNINNGACFYMKL